MHDEEENKKNRKARRADFALKAGNGYQQIYKIEMKVGKKHARNVNLCRYCALRNIERKKWWEEGRRASHVK